MSPRYDDVIREVRNLLHPFLPVGVLCESDDDVTRALHAIAEEPEVRNEVELSFLAKPQMELLYEKLGRVQAHEYIEHLLRETDDSWGVWAVARLGAYLTNLPDYCTKCFSETPKLNLPTLKIAIGAIVRMCKSMRLKKNVFSKIYGTV